MVTLLCLFSCSGSDLDLYCCVHDCRGELLEQVLQPGPVCGLCGRDCAANSCVSKMLSILLVSYFLIAGWKVRAFESNFRLLVFYWFQLVDLLFRRSLNFEFDISNFSLFSFSRSVKCSFKVGIDRFYLNRPVKRGKWYFEAQLMTDSFSVLLGWCNSAYIANPPGPVVGSCANSWSFNLFRLLTLYVLT